MPVQKRTYSLGIIRKQSLTVIKEFVDQVFVDVTIDEDRFYFEVYKFTNHGGPRESYLKKKFVKREQVFFDSEEQLEELRTRICQQLEKEGL